MGRVEVEGISLQAHALNEGIDDTMLEGSIRFDSSNEGIAVVLDLKTVGKKTVMTDALRDMVLRTLRSQSLVVRYDGEEIRSEAPGENVVGRVSSPQKLKSLKRLPCGGPVLIQHGS